MPEVEVVSKLKCQECGTEFNCGSTAKHSCWCLSLPNMREQFDLAGSCLCPDCLTLGQAKAIIKQRKKRGKTRRNNAIR